MAQKDRAVRRIDERNDNLVTGGGQLIQGGTVVVTLPGLPSAPPPQNVTISGQALLRTTYTPKVAVGIEWDAPINLLPELYYVEYAENSTFTSGLLRATTTQDRIVVEMKPAKDYWVRVQAQVRGVFSEYGYPDNYPSASVTTIGDTTAPNPVSGVTTNWSTGDLIIKWTNPTSDNFFRTRVRLYDTNGGTLYKERLVVGNPGATSEYRFTVDENYEVTSNNPLTSVYYELLAYSIAGVPSATTVTGTVTKVKPTLPVGLTTTWSGDDGTYDEGVTFSWTAVSGVSDYILTIDGSAKNTKANAYVYNYTENVANHRPTLVSGDYSLSYTVQAKDPLNQLSGGASGTATNLAPSSSNLSLNYISGFSTLYAYVTPAKEILDLYRYRYVLKSGGVNVQVAISSTPEITFTKLQGIYDLDVYAIDLFGRASNPVAATGILIQGLTIEQLRAEARYKDSIGTDPAILAGLKDAIVGTDVSTHTGASWRWTQFERPLTERYKTLNIAGATSSNIAVYFATSLDESNWTYYAGPLTAVDGAGTTVSRMNDYTTEADAQTNAVLLSTYPSNRGDLDGIREAKYVRMYHRSVVSGTYALREFYPRRMIQSDDIDAETIRGINIAALTITADKINVISLEALTIYTGSLTVSGVISIHSTGGIYQGTGTFASPTTGLKLYNSGGIGKLASYRNSIEQATFDTDGVLKAGAGAVKLTASGVEITATQSLSTPLISEIPAIKWYNGATVVGSISTYYNTSIAGGIMSIRASGPGTSRIEIGTATSISSTLTVNGGDITIENNGLQVGATASNPSDGQINAASTIKSESQGVYSTGTNAGLVFQDRTSAQNWQWYGTSAVARLYNGSGDRFSIDDDGTTKVLLNDATTAAAPRALYLYHRTSGTPAANFGLSLSFNADSATVADREVALIQAVYRVATDASRTADLRFFGADTALREGFRVGGTGTAAGIGFFAAGIQAKQTVTGSRGGNAALASLLTALSNYGLITDSSSA